MIDYAATRDHMVRNQIERRGVRDRQLLAAMRRVPPKVRTGTLGRVRA